MKNRVYYLLIALLSTFLISSCEDVTEPILPAPTIENVEIGSGNNHIGVIGRDFHLNADIVAGHKIDLVTVKIEQIAGESYTSDWGFELIWEQYKGAKNTNVHKHFNIPDDAVEGRYNFLLIVIDENGTKLEEKRAITLYAPENLPLDLRFDFGVDGQNADSEFIDVMYSQQNIYDSQCYKSEKTLKKSDFLVPVVNIAELKGDGQIYCLLINKKHNHRPESVGTIDFSKAIVADFWEHKDLIESRQGSNMFDFSTDPLSIIFPSIQIGATDDKNRPSQPIVGEKAWESGEYYIGFVYHNSTYNMGVFHYGEVTIEME